MYGRKILSSLEMARAFDHGDDHVKISDELTKAHQKPVARRVVRIFEKLKNQVTQPTDLSGNEPVYLFKR